MKKVIVFAAVVCAALLTGCNMSQPESAIFDYDYNEMNFIQLEEPVEGQQMCVIDTTAGTIKAVLYPDLAPNTVSNFIARVNDGFYDGKSIYGVWENAYFMTGAFDDTFSSGATEDGQPIPAECSVDLWPFKGALISIFNNVGYGDSRFIVANDYPVTDEEREVLTSFKDKSGEQLIPNKLIDTMIEKPGYWQVSGFFTVFGQTVEGFDVIEKITSVDVDEETFMPVEDILINSITLTTYNKES